MFIIIITVATTIGTVVAYLLVPMRSLGPDSWKIAAALMGRHIGGVVNYVAISDALGVQPSVLAAGLAADNVICALYFSALFALASKVPPEPSASVDDDAMNLSGSGDKLPVLQMATSLAVSFAICKAATILTGYFGIQGGLLKEKSKDMEWKRLGRVTLLTEVLEKTRMEGAWKRNFEQCKAAADRYHAKGKAKAGSGDESLNRVGVEVNDSHSAGNNFGDPIEISFNSQRYNSLPYTPIIGPLEEELWSKLIKSPEVFSINVLFNIGVVQQITTRVVNNCFAEQPSTIWLYDEELAEEHQCVLKRRDTTNGTFLAKGWYKFAKERKLMEGDILRLVIRYPLVEEIIVRVERGNGNP
ncbi:hypothetical protein RYX36_013564 [Vicia faba]